MGGDDESTDQDRRHDERSNQHEADGPKGDTPRDTDGGGDESRTAAATDDTSSSALRRHVTKRRVLGGVVLLLALAAILVVLVVPSGLVGLLYSSSAEFEAQPAATGAEAFTAADYEQLDVEELVVEEQRSVLGQTKTVATTNYVTDYERTIDVQRESFDAALLTLVTTPAIDVAGRPLNPLAGMSHEQLLSEFGNELDGEYAGLDNLEKIDEHEGVLLGKRTTVTQFQMSVEREGEQIDVYLYVADVRSNGDLVVAVGGHPAPFAQERASIFELMAAAEHPS